MSEHERETAFLGQVLSHDETAESQRLKASINQAQQHERCMRRALRLPALWLVLASIGMGYCGTFGDGGASNITWSVRQSVANAFCGAGVGALLSALVLLVLVAVYHKQTCERREEGRRFATKLLEAHLGKPAILPPFGVVKGPEIA